MEVRGFKAAAVAGGLRYKNRSDVGLIVADEPAAAAGVFTLSLTQAAPVLWSKPIAAQGRARAILVNAGQANACTGEAGLENARRSAEAVAKAVGCGANEVFLASTGVIGQPLNIEAMEKCVPELKSNLAGDKLTRVAEAMMTTDTVRKIVEVKGTIQGKEFTVAGMAKGSGMICPNMATMLSFVLTDAAVSPEMLQAVLSRTAETTFNRITVDGDTSTNDTVFALASGRAGNVLIDKEDAAGLAEFETAFHKVMDALSVMIATDGEGATKLVRLQVTGAVDDAQAKAAAMTVANSPLVKTAWFGQDANWGRIMGALGRSGASFDPYRVDILVDDAPLVKGGMDAGEEASAAKIMKNREFTVRVDLGAGQGRAEVLTCDLSIDYVKINADYRS